MGIVSGPFTGPTGVRFRSHSKADGNAHLEKVTQEEIFEQKGLRSERGSKCHNDVIVLRQGARLGWAVVDLGVGVWGGFPQESGSE